MHFPEMVFFVYQLFVFLGIDESGSKEQGPQRLGVDKAVQFDILINDPIQQIR